MKKLLVLILIATILAIGVSADESGYHKLIANNTIFNIFDDAIEVGESYSKNMTITQNVVYDVFVGVSLAPSNCAVGPCDLTYNQFTSTKTIVYNSTSNWSPYTFKADTNGNYTYSWNIDHNTFYSTGEGFDGIRSRSIRNTNITNNIFYSASTIMSLTGYASDSARYDYNLYYRSSAGGQFCGYNTAPSTTCYDSLALAKTSAYGTDAWDNNSVNLDPLFVDASARNYTPRTSSSACGAGSGGSDIGALDCEVGGTTTTIIYLDSPGNGSSVTSASIDVVAEITAATLNNITLYINGVAQPIYGPKILAYYPFDNNTYIGEGTNTIKDVSLYNNPVNITGTTVSTSCRFGSCRAFDGDGDRLDLNYTGAVQLNTTQNYTIMFNTIFYPKSNNIFNIGGGFFNDWLSSARNGTTLYLHNSTSYYPEYAMQAQIRDATATANTLTSHLYPKFGEWHRIGFTRAGTNYTIYVDGELVDSESYTVSYTPTRTLMIGSYGTTANYALNGTIDEFVLVNDTLPQDVMRRHYNLIQTDSDTWIVNLSYYAQTGSYEIYLDVNGDTTSDVLNITMSKVDNASVTIDLSSPTKVINFTYGVQDDQAYNLFTYNTTGQQMASNASYAGYNRIWVVTTNVTANPNSENVVPLLDDCSSYDYTNLTAIVTATLDSNLKPLFSFAHAPRCMIPEDATYSSCSSPPPLNYTNFSNYVAAVVTYYKGLCDAETLSCGEFTDWQWEIWNEPGCGDAFGSTQAQVINNYTALYNLTYDAIKAAVPSATVSSAGDTDISEAAFYNAIPGRYPDRYSFHNYDNAASADPAMSGYDYISFYTFVRGVKNLYYHYTNYIVNLVRDYKSDTLIYNDEYNLDSGYSPGSTYVKTQEGAAWMASVLYWQLQTNMSGEVFYKTASTVFGLWNQTDLAPSPMYFARSDITPRFQTGENLYIGVSTDEDIEVMATDDAITIINKKSVPVEVTLSFSGGTVPVLVNTNGTAYSGSTYTFVIDEFGVETYDTSTPLVTGNVTWIKHPLKTSWQDTSNYEGGEGFESIYDIDWNELDTNILYLTKSYSRVLKSEDGGFTWYYVGRDVPPKGGQGIASDPNNPNVVYLASSRLSSSYTRASTEGIWRSIDGGANWEQVLNANYTGYKHGKIILFDPSAAAITDNVTQSNTIYVGTGNGVYKTTDAGDTFTSLGLAGIEIYDLDWDTNTRDVVYIATNMSNRIYKLNVSSSVITQIGSGLPSVTYDLEVDEDNAGTIYAGTSTNIYRSTDYGSSFSTYGSGQDQTASYRFIKKSGVYMYAAPNARDVAAPYYSTDSGATWSLASDVSPSQVIHDDYYYSMAIAVNPDDSTQAIAGRGSGTMKTVDNGQTWTYSSDGQLGAQLSDIDFLSTSTWYYCIKSQATTAGGIYKTTDAGNTFTRINVTAPAGYTTSDICTALDVLSNGTIVASRGTSTDQDIAMSFDGGATWSIVYNDTQSFTFMSFDALNQSVVYADNRYSLDGGTTWNTSSYEIKAIKDGTSTIYGTLDGGANIAVAKSTDYGESWTVIGSAFITPNAYQVASDPHDPITDHLSVATDSGVYEYTGGSWVLRGSSNGLSTTGAKFKYVAYDPTVPGRVWAGAEGSAGHVPGIFVSDDNGESWTDVTNNLGPYLDSMAIEINPNTGVVYWGTADGIYYLSESDTVSPIIISVSNSSITYTGMNVNYYVDEEVNSTLDYGVCPSTGTRTSKSAFADSDTYSLSGLSISSVYCFNLTVYDSSGNTDIKTFNYSTLSQPGSEITFSTGVLNDTEVNVNQSLKFNISIASTYPISSAYAIIELPNGSLSLVSMSNETNVSYYVDYNNSVAGSYEIVQVNATDNNSYSLVANLSGLAFTIYDVVAPVITVLSPTNDQRILSGTVVLNITVTDANLDTMTVSFYDTDSGALLNSTSSVASGTNIKYTWSSLPDSYPCWHATAYDGTFNTTTGTYCFGYGPVILYLDGRPTDRTYEYDTTATLLVDLPQGTTNVTLSGPRFTFSESYDASDLSGLDELTTYMPINRIFDNTFADDDTSEVVYFGACRQDLATSNGTCNDLQTVGAYECTTGWNNCDNVYDSSNLTYGDLYWPTSIGSVYADYIRPTGVTSAEYNVVGQDGLHAYDIPAVCLAGTIVDLRLRLSRDTNVTYVDCSENDWVNVEVFGAFTGAAVYDEYVIWNSSEYGEWSYPTWYNVTDLEFNISDPDLVEPEDVVIYVNDESAKLLKGVIEDGYLKTHKFSDGQTSTNEFIFEGETKTIYLDISTNEFINLSMNVTGYYSDPVPFNSTIDFSSTAQLNTTNAQGDYTYFIIDDFNSNLGRMSEVSGIDSSYLSDGEWVVSTSSSIQAGPYCAPQSDEETESGGVVYTIDLLPYDEFKFSLSCVAQGTQAGDRDNIYKYGVADSNCGFGISDSPSSTGTSTFNVHGRVSDDRFFDADCASVDINDWNYATYDGDIFVRKLSNNLYNVSFSAHCRTGANQAFPIPSYTKTISGTKMYLTVYVSAYTSVSLDDELCDNNVYTTASGYATATIKNVYLRGIGRNYTEAAGYNTTVGISSKNLFNSTVNITGVLVNYTTYGDSDKIMLYVSPDNGTNWEETDNGRFHRFINNGRNLAWKIFANSTDTEEQLGVTKVNVSIISTSVSNLTFDVGYDGVIDYNITGIFNNSLTILINDSINKSINDYLNDTCEREDSCQVPIAIYSDTTGGLLLNSLVTMTNLNPVKISDVGTSSGNVSALVTSGSGVTIYDWKAYLKGDLDNLAISATLVNSTGASSYNYTIDVKYTPFTFTEEDPAGLAFIPTAPTVYYLQPEFQTDSDGYYDISLITTLHTGDLYIKHNASLPACAALYWSNQSLGTKVLMSTASQKAIGGFYSNETPEIWLFLNMTACTEGFPIDVALSTICTGCVETYDFDEWDGTYG